MRHSKSPVSPEPAPTKAGTTETPLFTRNLQTPDPEEEKNNSGEKIIKTFEFLCQKDSFLNIPKQTLEILMKSNLIFDSFYGRNSFSDSQSDLVLLLFMAESVIPAEMMPSNQQG